MQNSTSFLKSELDLLHGDTLQGFTNSQFLLNPTQTNYTTRLLETLTNYEESFFWTFKRFYLTLGLQYQRPLFLTLPRPQNLSFNTSKSLPSHTLPLPNHVVNFNFLTSTTSHFAAGGVASPSTLLVDTKDVHLVTAEKDLLSLDDEVTVLDILAPGTPAATHVINFPQQHPLQLLAQPTLFGERGQPNRLLNAYLQPSLDESLLLDLSLI